MANGKGSGVVFGYDVNPIEDGSTENDSRPPRGEIGKLFRPTLLAEVARLQAAAVGGPNSDEFG